MKTCNMKRLFFACLASLCFSGFASAQFSKVLDSCNMQSTILGGERKYAVYLPPGYDTSSRNYPVLYLLHGGGDDQTGWVQFGEVQSIADKAIAEGKATPMVILMPDISMMPRGNGATKTFSFKSSFRLSKKCIESEARNAIVRWLDFRWGEAALSYTHFIIPNSSPPLARSVRARAHSLSKKPRRERFEQSRMEIPKSDPRSRPKNKSKHTFFDTAHSI